MYGFEKKWSLKKQWSRIRGVSQHSLRFDTLIVGILFLGIIIAAFFFRNQTATVIDFAKAHLVLGGILYVIFLTFSIVVLPFSSVPVTLAAAAIWGIPLGGFLCGFGSWFGGMVLFSIARYAGRPFASHFFSFKKIDTWQEKMPEKITFAGIILAHLVLPVEAPSIIFGVDRKLPFSQYALASVFGIFPMSYLIVATGGALFSQDWIILGAFAAGIIIIFSMAYLLWKKYFKKNF